MKRDGIPTEEVQSILRTSSWDYQPVILRAMVRRMLVQRGRADQTASANYTGTMLPEPFDDSRIAIQTMVGQPDEAVQFYASRYAANPPVPVVMPLTMKQDISGKLNKLAGEQELFDALLLDEMGIGAGNRINHRKLAMAQAITEEGAYVVLPKDMGFGIPLARQLFTDEEAEMLKGEGKISPVPREIDGKRFWVEHADAWAERKREASKQNGINGARLFDLQAYPRDMIRYGLDSEGVKWAAVVEDINAEQWCGAGTDLGRAAAKRDGIASESWDDYGLWFDEKDHRIIGGVEKGGPPDRTWTRRGTWTLIRFFTRTELIYLVSPSSTTYNGAKEIYRLRHGATDRGRPVCPFFPVPAMRMDVDTPGQNVTGPASRVFGWAPLVNQLLTLFSAAGVYNTIPRYYGMTPDGKIIRGEDGEPIISDNAAVPGMRADELGIYAFEIKQLVIDTDTVEALLPVYLQQLADAMPAPAIVGEAASSSTAWGAAQNIQQAQLTLVEPVENHRLAVKQILRVCHGWLRQLDVPIYFFNRPSSSRERREGRGLVEFDPSKLMDDFEVEQDIDTPDERVVRIQMGLELLQSGKITDRDFYEDYMKERDPDEAIVKQWQQLLVNAYLKGAQAVGITPESGLAQFLQQLQGNVHQMMLEESPAYALGTARNMAEQANQQAQMMSQPGGEPGGAQQGLGGGVSNAAGVRRPGMGMANNINDQLGSNAPMMAPPTGF